MAVFMEKTRRDFWSVHLEAPDLVVVTGDMIVGSLVNRRTFAF
ncbi:MAG: hypothetical protein ACLS5R_07930 [Blautia sp.]